MQNFINKLQNEINENKADLMTLENLRKDIISELDAINDYEKHASETSNLDMKKVWLNIAKDEKVHFGELTNMLFKLDSNAYEQFQKGVDESNSLLGENKI